MRAGDGEPIAALAVAGGEACVDEMQCAARRWREISFSNIVDMETVSM
jgi:hypothetical protein